MKRKLQIFFVGLVIGISITLSLAVFHFLMLYLQFDFYLSGYQERFYFLGWPLVSAFIAYLLARKNFPRFGLGFALSGMLPGLTALIYPGALIVQEILNSEHPHYGQIAVGVLVIAVMITAPSLAICYAFKRVEKDFAKAII